MPAVRRLPDQFPVGTHYVVEGVPDQDGELTITSRYLVLPNGIQVPVPVSSRRRRRRPASEHPSSMRRTIRA